MRLADKLGAPSPLAPLEPREPEPCLNCGTAVTLEYCPRCGQRRGDYRRSVFGFLRELVAETLEVDGRVGRTLRLLLFRPGALTREYAAGRRQRYISPLRLYLFISLALFATVSVVTRFEIRAERSDAAQSGSAEPDNMQFSFDRTGLEGTFLDPLVRTRLEKLEAMPPSEAAEEMVVAFFESLPVVMFLLLPLFGFLVMLTMLGRGRFYVEHLVFAVHLHCFWFVVALLSFLVSQLTGWSALLLLVIPGYSVFALQHAYDASWGATLLRSVFVWAAYGLCLGAGLATAFVLGVAFG